MSISTAKLDLQLDTLYHIASFLGEPAPGCSKQFQFAQLVRDLILFRKLQQMNLPLFSFLNQRDITSINPNQGLVAELDRIHAIFRDIHVAAKNNLTAAQFNDICTQHETRTLSRYIQLSVAHQANQDHAVTVLADTLRDQIPAIPNTPVEIRAWFANPANQGALQRITHLDMREKQLKCLPDEIGQLVNLRELDLDDNQLRALPDSFGQLVNLQRLYLHHNQLTALPETFGNLAHLIVLALAYNKLTDLPETFENLVKLECLYLRDNQLTTLPETFGQLVNLRELGLAHNQLNALPETFGQLVNLQELYLEYNQLRTLPESFGNLAHLTTLHLNHNQLITLHESIKRFLQEKRFQLRTPRIVEGGNSDDGIGGGGGGGAAAND